MGGHLTEEAHSSSSPSHPSLLHSTVPEWVQRGEATSPKSHSSGQHSEYGNPHGSFSEIWAACLPQLSPPQAPPHSTQEGGKHNSTQGGIMVNLKSFRLFALWLINAPSSDNAVEYNIDRHWSSTGSTSLSYLTYLGFLICHP